MPNPRLFLKLGAVGITVLTLATPLVSKIRWVFVAGLLTLCVPTLPAADPFAEKIVPFLKTFCTECHNTKKASGELDLTRFTSSAKLLDDFRQWEHIITFVKKEEMPPAKAKQPTAELRAEMLKLFETVLHEEARKLAGDPGVVPSRRLTNAEYDNTIRDLTGHEIRPAKAFPIDPASGEGFNNTGESLTMSPSLFKKYYAAAEYVADHAVLTTTGLKFAPHTAVTFADRQKLYETAILNFYTSHAVDYEKYLTMLWRYQRRPAEQKQVTVAEWAKKHTMSEKYADTLWNALNNESADPFFLLWLREQWKALPAEDGKELRAAIRKLSGDITKLSLELCVKETPAIVANAGNGPINHLAARRKMAASRMSFEPANISKLSVPNLPKELNADVSVSAAAYCKLFPNRFYSVDSTRGLSAGFHLIEGFFRDDQPLCELVLSDAEKKELDQLWKELYFVTGIWEKMLRGFVFFERSERNFLKHRDFDSFKEEDPDLVKDESLVRFKSVYLTRSNVKATGEELATHPISIFFEEVRDGLRGQTKLMKDAEPIYRKELLAFAERAYRRPLTNVEREKLEKSYAEIAADANHGIEAAVRATIVRILMSPHFCMRFQPMPPGDTVAALPDYELASRLSYFVWSGPPDAELLALAKAGKLREESVLREQVRRMVKSEKVSRFTLEFFGQWLGYRDFLSQESVNRQVFPAFDDALKNAMFEEPTRLATHLIQQDKPITNLLNGDATILNKKLAQHYGINFTGDDWQLVSGLHAKGRGGLLGMAVFLTKNSQPQRTSPVKRGFWVVHKLLGEHIPPPPPDVAVLPAKETEANVTVRQLLKQHVADEKCARCHQRFDPVGLAMEGFDPIGRGRTKDLAGRAIDNVVSLPDKPEAHGIPEFGNYLAKHRQHEFTKTLTQKFLGYALGRSLILSDQPLLEKMQKELDTNDNKLSAFFELVATSPQFRTQRCQDFSPVKFQK